MELEHIAKLVAPDLGYVLREELYSNNIKDKVLLITYLCHPS
jgi:aminopeptidase-like protein